MAIITEYNVSTGQSVSRELTPEEVAQYPKPTEEQLKSKCKSKAELLLSETDWSEIPSVSNTQNTPHLINVSNFVTYRNEVRNFAVNPVADPIFPTLPIAQWS